MCVCSFFFHLLKSEQTKAKNEGVGEDGEKGIKLRTGMGGCTNMCAGGLPLFICFWRKKNGINLLRGEGD